MKDSGDFNTTARRRLEDLQWHLEGERRGFFEEPASQVSNTLGAWQLTMELLPYLAATMFFIFVAALTILGPDFRRFSKPVPSSANATAPLSAAIAVPPPAAVAKEKPAPVVPVKIQPAAVTVTPSSPPKAEPWADTLAAFQQAVSEKKTLEEAERRKLLDQFQDRLNAKNLR